MMDTPKNWLPINDFRYSESDVPLPDLDFSQGWTDRFFAPVYLGQTKARKAEH